MFCPRDYGTEETTVDEAERRIAWVWSRAAEVVTVSLQCKTEEERGPEKWAGRAARITRTFRR